MESIGFLSNLFGFPGIWLGIELQELGFEGWSELDLFGVLKCWLELHYGWRGHGPPSPTFL
jgi:hypothetical protein